MNITIDLLPVILANRPSMELLLRLMAEHPNASSEQLRAKYIAAIKPDPVLVERALSWTFNQDFSGLIEMQFEMQQRWLEAGHSGRPPKSWARCASAKNTNSNSATLTRRCSRSR